MSREKDAFAAAIFDFEGTLVDFQWQLGPAEAELRREFAKLGFEGEAFALANYASMWNAAAETLAPHGRMAELRRAIAPVYDRWDADALTRWAARPEAAQLLRSLAAMGIRTGMVSNIGRAALAPALERFDFARWLSPVVSRDDVTFMKPRGEGILSVLREWRMAPQSVLFVGDSRADVLGARAAGLRVAIIRGGECAQPDFADLSPDHWVSRPGELEELIAG
ncbi:MAG: HAD family hydrolase [Betaproteobacteria bacterium]|nr:HAD family hydrolase [Betaproteobacteria bacterium]